MFRSLKSRAGVLGLTAIMAGGSAVGLAGPAFAGPSSNRLLASGSVTEAVFGGNWVIDFNIHAQGDGQSSNVSVQPGSGAAFSFNTNLCAGTYTDPSILGGTTVYGIGQADSGSYYGFKVHEGGVLGADYSWVDLNISTLAAAQAACANPAGYLSLAYFGLVAADVKFKV